MPRKGPSHRAKAVVTGAGSGIGRAFAHEIARRGGSVVCSDRNIATAEATVAEICANGGQAFAVACDVTELEQVEALAESAAKALAAPVDLVINNAGVGAGGQRIGETAIDDWRWTLNVNLWGVIHGCHVFAPKLRTLGRGGILNVGSAACFSAAPMMGAYNVSKAGVMALSETLAAECDGSGVRVSVLCPTFVRTGIVESGRIAAGSAGIAAKLMQRFGSDADAVARFGLDALDRGRLHALPQRDARAIWRFKRLVPAVYGRASAALGRRLSRDDNVAQSSSSAISE